jgi:hypothetical protein
MSSHDPEPERRVRAYLRHPDLQLALYVDAYGPAFVPPWRDRPPAYRMVVPTPDWIDEDDPHADAARPRAERRQPEGGGY